MWKKLLLAVAIAIMTMSMAFAQVDANKGDQVALDSVKGIGPAMSKRILAERKNGKFKDWVDFETRVKGVGPKSAAKLSDAGLTINGQPRSGKKNVTTNVQNKNPVEKMHHPVQR